MQFHSPLSFILKEKSFSLSLLSLVGVKGRVRKCACSLDVQRVVILNHHHNYIIYLETFTIYE